MALLLVEKGYYKEVEFVFLVVGHTKNPCDRWFNALKADYRRQNLFTFKELLKSVNKNNNLEAHEVANGVFCDWGSYLDQLYSKFKSGTVKNNHIFSVKAGASFTLMRIHQSDVPTERNTIEQDFYLRGMTMEERKQLLSEVPNELEQPGLPLIKRMELGKKWIQYVPETSLAEDGGEIYCRPTKEDEKEYSRMKKRKLTNKKEEMKRKKNELKEQQDKRQRVEN